MPVDDLPLDDLAAGAKSRLDFWARFVRGAGVRVMAEIGVYRGAFAVHMLKESPQLVTYYMVDPWRHLEHWEKPANKSDQVFERYYSETLASTAEWAAKRVVLRGTTTEVIDQVADESLDLAYIDGDHTLRGITIDLARLYPKVRPGGWIGGDDFCPSIWQHPETFEPTLVFPYAVHFAEAVGARIFGLPRDQFLIEKRRSGGFAFVDLAAGYDELELRGQLLGALRPEPTPRSRLRWPRRPRGG